MCILMDMIKRQNIESNNKVVSENKKTGEPTTGCVPAAESKILKAKCRNDECDASGWRVSTSRVRNRVNRHR
jgi:hypothetical protein